jgi:hypothetical protein
VWDGTQFVSISSPIAAVPNAVSSYSSSAPASRTTRTNLVTNPSFEVDTTGWAGNGVATLSRDTSLAQFGASSVKVTLGNASFNGLAGTYFIPVEFGKTYALSLYAYIAFGKPDGLHYLTVGLSSNGTSVNQAYSDTSVTLAAGAGWTRLSRTFSPESTTTHAAIFFTRPGAAAGAEIYLDGVLFEQSSTVGAYFDGTTYQTIPEAYPSSILTAWTGTANASTSTISYYKQSDVKVGQLWVDSDDRSLYVYNGAEWVIAAAATATIPSINLNSNVIATDYTMPVGYNGTSAGPITVNSGVTVTIPSGSVWTVV